MEPMKIVVVLMVMLFASPFILQIAAGAVLVSLVILVMVPVIAVLTFHSYRWYYVNKTTSMMELDYPEEDAIEDTDPERP